MIQSNSHLLQSIPQLETLIPIINAQQYQNCFIVTGSSNSGKYSFIASLLGCQVTSTTNDDAEEILQIQNQPDKTLIADGTIQIFSDTNKKTLFIKMKGLLESDNNSKQKERLILAIQLIIETLNKNNIITKFILVFAHQQLVQDDQIVLKFKQNFKRIRNLADRTFIIVSKCAYHEQFDEFIGVLNNLEANNKDGEIVTSIIQQQRVFPFLTTAFQDQQQLNLLIAKLYDTSVITPIQFQSIPNIYQHIQKYYINQNQIQIQIVKQLKTCLQILNSIMKLIILESTNEHDKVIINQFTQKWEQIYGEKVVFETSENIKDQIKLKKFFGLFEELKQSTQKSYQEFLQLLLDNLFEIRIFLSQKLQSKGIFGRIILLAILSRAFHQTNTETLPVSDIEQIFGHENSFTDDHLLSKVYNKCKTYFSEDFAQKHKALQSSKPISRKKTKKKNSIPSYQQQKQNFQDKKRNLNEILSLTISPLRIQQLIKEFQKRKNQTKHNITEEKIIIDNLIHNLTEYKCFKQAALVCFTVPKNYNLLENTLKYLEEPNANDLNFITKVYHYFIQINRSQYSEKIKQKLTQTNSRLIIPELTQSHVEIKHTFMNYEEFNNIIKIKAEIIQKCLDFESKNGQLLKFIQAKHFLTTKYLEQRFLDIQTK